MKDSDCLSFILFRVFLGYFIESEYLGRVWKFFWGDGVESLGRLRWFKFEK